MTSQILTPVGSTQTGGSLFARVAILVFVVMTTLFGLGLAVAIPA